MLAMKAFQGAGLLVFSRFLSRVIDFFTLLILARILTPADFGLTALAMTLVLIVDVVLEVPVGQALLRLESIDKSHLDTGFTLGVLRSGLVALIVLAAAWPFAVFNNEQLIIPVAAALAIGPIARGVQSPGMIRFIRELGFWQTFIAEFSGKLIAFAVAMTTLHLGGTYWAIVANFVTASVATMIATYVLAPYWPRLSLSRFADFSGFIGWFSSAQLVSALNWQFDRLLIGATLDKPTLGRYAVASDVAVLPTQSLIGPALQPVMAAFSKISAEPERLRRAFLKAARFAMLISVPACLGISLTADLVVNLLLGSKWQDAAPLLSLLALSVIPIPYFQTLYSLSVAVDRPAILLRLNLIDLGLRVFLVSIGLYFFSVIGASGGRVLVSAAMFAFYLIQIRQLIQVSLSAQLQNLWKVAAAAAVMMFCVLLLRRELAGLGLNGFSEFFLVVTTGAAAYLGALGAFGLRLIMGGGRLELADRW
jgi:PST family polysaccharide transporter